MTALAPGCFCLASSLGPPKNQLDVFPYSRAVPDFYYDLAQRYTGKVGFLTLDKAQFGYMTMSLGYGD